MLLSEAVTSVELQCGQTGIETAFGLQLCMGALLHQATALHHPNHISTLHCGQTMRNHQGGATDHGLVQSGLHHLLALRVERTGGLVQQQEWRVFQNGSRNRNALALTARQTHTPIA